MPSPGHLLPGEVFMKTISHTQFRLSAAAALLILIALDNHAGAQQFYDHGRQSSTVRNGAVPEDYYRQAMRVEGPITRSTPPFGYYAAPRPKELYRMYWNDSYSNNASLNGLSRELNRQRTRQRPQLDAYGHTMAHLNGTGVPENAAARALPADTVYRYESTDLKGTLHVPLNETRQTVSAKRIIHTDSGDNNSSIRARETTIDGFPAAR